MRIQIFITRMRLLYVILLLATLPLFSVSNSTPPGKARKISGGSQRKEKIVQVAPKAYRHSKNSINSNCVPAKNATTNNTAASNSIGKTIVLTTIPASSVKTGKQYTPIIIPYHDLTKEKQQELKKRADLEFGIKKLGKSKYKCMQCGFRERSRTFVYRHIISHSNHLNTQIQCTCGKNFAYGSVMNHRAYRCYYL